MHFQSNQFHRSLAAATAMALALSATSAEAAGCQGNRSINALGVPTPAFDWYCQSYTSGTRTTNQALDDWRNVFPETPGELTGTSGEDVIGAGPRTSGPEYQRLLAARNAARAKVAALKAQLAKELAEQARIQEQRDWFKAREEEAQWLLNLREGEEAAISAAEQKIAEMQQVRAGLGGDEETQTRLRADLDTDIEALQQQVAEHQANLAATDESLAALGSALGPEAENEALGALFVQDDVVAHAQSQLAEAEADLQTAQLILDEYIHGGQGGGEDIPTTGIRTSFKNGPAELKWSWWSTGDLTRSDQSGSPLLTDTTTASFLTGFSTNPTANSGLSFGVGFGRAVTDETDPFGGGTTTTNTLKTRLTGYITEGPLTFDASGTFDYSWAHRDRGWFTDDYNTHAFGLGAGVNGSLPVAASLGFDWRLGYAGTWTTRHASTDTTGVRSTRATTALHRGSANGKLVHTLPSGGSLYGEATLNAIIADTSVAGRTANPFDVDLGAGGSFDLGGFSLDLGASYGGLGRAGEESLGLTAGLSVQF